VNVRYFFSLSLHKYNGYGLISAKESFAFLLPTFKKSPSISKFQRGDIFLQQTKEVLHYTVYFIRTI